MNQFTPISEDSLDADWSFYIYVAKSILNLSFDEFLRITPRLWLELYILHLEYAHPEALKKEKQTYTLDQTPFM